MARVFERVYLERAIGTSTVSGLVSTTAALNERIASATDLLNAMLVDNGYNAQTTTGAPPLIKDAVLGLVLEQLYAFKDTSAPEQFITRANFVFQRLEDGRKLPGIAQTTRDAAGGSKWSDTSSTASDSRPRIYDKLRDNY